MKELQGMNRYKVRYQTILYELTEVFDLGCNSPSHRLCILAVRVRG